MKKARICAYILILFVAILSRVIYKKTLVKELITPHLV